jgi:hypothetical protein
MSALITIVTDWLSDIKLGYCSNAWWLNQKFCCWEIENSGKKEKKEKKEDQEHYFKNIQQTEVVLTGQIGVNL